jgi:alkanesulfonate monooxygenase SsuD/methylene tetrahydromethanopterin reductase-like flavin-dependent oxidoreductase (luciferase family)
MFAVGGYLAASTSQVIIHLNLVVMGYRNPFLVARSISTLDHLARGRLMVGIGAGYMRAEFEALGADFSRRGALVDEGVAAMKEAWSGEPVSLEAPTWRARGNSMRPRPFSTPHPKLFRGGNTKQAIESAVRHFDGWNPFEAPLDFARKARTASIASETDLRKRVALLRDLEQQLERRDPLEISLDKPDPAWLRGSPESVADHIGRLEEIGVSWLAIYLSGSTMAEVIEGVHALADIVPRRASSTL